MCEETAIINLPVKVDKCLVPLLKIMNKYGMRTEYSCCGHNGKDIGSRSPYIVIDAENAEVFTRHSNGDGVWQEAKDVNIEKFSFDLIIHESGK